MRHKRYGDEITFETLNTTERIILLDAAESRGELIGFFGPQSEKYGYESLCELGLLKRVLVKSGRSPEYGYLITQKGWEGLSSSIA